VLAAWFTVAHDSGAGWVQTIGALVAGALVVGLVAPLIAVLRLRVRVVSNPADALARVPATLQVSLSAPAEVRAVHPPGPVALSGRSPSTALEVVPARRGVVETCTLEIASAAPFGLVWWTRTLTVPLARPMAVAPRVGTPAREVLDEVPDAPRLSAMRGRGTATRGARPYEPGDPRRLVHWPASAHAGRLMVRETDRQSPRTVAVDGTLPENPAAADEQAGRVLATVVELLGQGCRVQLRTVEPGRVVVDTVAGAATASRRLALALPRDDDR
jgi:uncharacterized protein (DUF58 family)